MTVCCAWAVVPPGLSGRAHAAHVCACARGPHLHGSGHAVLQAIHLWIHENMRCFHDRLVDATDRKYFMEELLMNVLKRNFHGMSQLTHEV